jgi:xanthine dehydrogenase iron-sulfur cluster and FAD-binding subunit A
LQNEDCHRIAKLKMAFGGVGPTTRMAKSTNGFEGLEWNEKSFEKISQKLAEEFCVAEGAPGGMAKLRNKIN